MRVPGQAPERDPDGGPAGQDAGERDGELHADREREHGAGRRGVSEHVSEEGLLGAEAARRQRQKRGRALGREGERGIDEVRGDAEGLEEEVHRQGAEDPARELERHDAAEVQPRRPQDRKAEAHPRPERDDVMLEPGEEDPGQDQDGGEDEREPLGVRGEEAPLERRQVAEGGQVRDLSVEVGGQQHHRPDDRVDQRLGQEARRDGGVRRPRHRPMRQVDLDHVPAAGRHDRVRPDAGEVGAEDAAAADATLGVGGLEDGAPRSRPQQQVSEVEGDRDQKDAPVDAGQVVPEGDRRVPEGLERAHAVKSATPGGRGITPRRGGSRAGPGSWPPARAGRASRSGGRARG